MTSNDSTPSHLVVARAGAANPHGPSDPPVRWRRRRSIERLVVAFAAATLAACTGSGEAPNDTLAPIEVVTPRDSDDLRAELAAARTRWSQNAALDYDYDVTSRCRKCLLDGANRSISIVDGERVGKEPDVPFSPNAPAFAGPVDELHDFIEDALDVVFLVDTEYDDIGRPTRIVISSEDVESPLDIDIAQTTFLYDYG